MIPPLLNQLVHIEIRALDVEASVRHYVEEVGLREVGRADGKVYLRCWGDYYPYSLVLSEGDQPGLVSTGWRTVSPDALDEAARRIQDAGVPVQWHDGGSTHGRSFVFTGPWGHTMEVFWEIERYRAPEELASTYPDRPEKRSRHAGAPRFFDHVTVAASDVRAFCDWHRDVLGFRQMGFADLDDVPGVTLFGVLTTNEKSHDLGVVHDASAVPGRIHHYAYWVDTREELLIGADVLMEHGTPIEYGPSLHGIGEQSYLYFRDPSGLRIEMNTGGYRNYVPDWEPQTWTPARGSNNFYRNGTMPLSMTEAFPAAPEPTATEQGVHPDTVEALKNPFGRTGRG